MIRHRPNPNWQWPDGCLTLLAAALVTIGSPLSRIRVWIQRPLLPGAPGDEPGGRA